MNKVTNCMNREAIVPCTPVSAIVILKAGQSAEIDDRQLEAARKDPTFRNREGMGQFTVEAQESPVGRIYTGFAVIDPDTGEQADPDDGD